MDRTRRAVLAGAGALGVTALAGCSMAGAAPRPPVVPENRLEEGGWELVAESTERAFEQSVFGVSVTGTASTRQYEDAALAAEVNAETLGQVTGQLSSFFATAVTFDPDVAGGGGALLQDAIVTRAERYARGEFVSQLEAAGLTDVTQSGTSEFDIETGETARLTNYRARFPFEGFAVRVADDASVAVEGGDVDVAAHLAVWYRDGAVLLSGGAYPAANYAETTTQALSSAVSVTVDIDLGLTPEAYRAELFGLMRRVR